jgi:dTDP-4-amino-4,6-dideoxygalactose transaminase
MDFLCERLNKRVYLSPPHMSGNELDFVQDAFQTNWIAPLGPQVDTFEYEVAALAGVTAGAALTSGTAALHLALRLIGIEAGDEVWVSTFTFVASVNPILYEGGVPVFIDSEEDTWNLDPDLLAAELEAAAERGKLPKALIVVDLYGQCADWDPILASCAQYGVPIVEDSAEAIGATYKGRAAGSFGKFGVFSFNGNKIITTSGGGMLVSRDVAAVARARFLASQARDSEPHYQHSQQGFNYRLSNVLAAIGRGQLCVLDERIARRKYNFERYKNLLNEFAGITFMPIAEHGEPNYWLTCILIDPREFGATRDDVRLALEAANIESRPLWKPMHLQPLFEGCRTIGGSVSERLFEIGLCLPSGSSLEDCDVERIIDVFRQVYRPATAVLSQ